MADTDKNLKDTVIAPKDGPELKPELKPEFTVPDEYKDKAYLKDVSSEADLYALLDNSQKVLGVKSVPDSTSSEKDWLAHYDKLGRPDSPEGYTFDDTELGVDSSLRNLFHANGVNVKQGDAIAKGYAELAAKSGDADVASYDAFLDSRYGDDADGVFSRAEKLLKGNIPTELHSSFLKLDARALGLLTVVIDNISKTYLDEGGAGGFTTTTGKPTSRESTIKAKMAELSKDSSYYTASGSALRAEHIELAGELNKLRDR